ncbi:MAG: nucleotidyltransferase domain-containing protein [Desulforhabdus sp.]|nr:nucleotidyltransferase domain-containing protein [Desulforhabdus sp.]
MVRSKAIQATNELAEEIESFCHKNEVELFILFGSRARGAPHAASDIDIALQFPLGREPSKLQLIHQLEMMLMPRTVDLVILTAEIDPLLLHEIFTSGRLLFEKCPGLFEKGRLRAWHLYLDTAPLRQKERDHHKRKRKGPADVA